MWRPSSSYSTAVHTSTVWTTEATEARTHHAEYERLAAAVAAQEGRVQSFDLPEEDGRTTTSTAQAFMLTQPDAGDDERFRGGKVVLPSAYQPANQAMNLDLTSPSALLLEQARMQRMMQGKVKQQQRAAQRAQNRQHAPDNRAEAMSRPNSSPYGAIPATPATHYHPSPPGTAPMGSIPQGVNPMSTTARASRPPMSIPMNLIVGSPNEITNYLATLPRVQRKAIISARQSHRLPIASFGGDLTSPPRPTAAEPLTDEQKLSAQAREAAMYYKLSQVTQPPSFEPVRPPTQQQQRSFSALSNYSHRPHTSGSARPSVRSSASGRGRSTTTPRLLQTTLQQFSADVSPSRAASSRPATSIAARPGTTQRAIRSANLATAHPSQLVPPSVMKAQNAVTPATSTAHWSTRIYVRNAPGAAGMNAEQKKVHHDAIQRKKRLQHQFASFAEDVAAKADQSHVSFATQEAYEEHRDPSIAPSASTASPATLVPTASGPPAIGAMHPRSLPGQLRREHRLYEAEERFLSRFDEQLGDTFDALISDARYRQHEAEVQGEIGMQKLELVRSELNKRADLPVHELAQSIKSAALASAASLQAKKDRTRSKVARRHWKTGELMPAEVVLPTLPTAEPGEEKEAAIQREIKSQHIQVFLDAIAAEEAEEHLRKMSVLAEDRARLHRERQQAKEKERKEQREPLEGGQGADQPEETKENDATHDEMHFVEEAPVVPPADTHLSRFDAHLQAVVGTQTFLRQSIVDTGDDQAQQQLLEEAEVKAQHRRQKRTEKRLRHGRRRGEMPDVNVVAAQVAAAGEGDHDSSSDSGASADDDLLHPEVKSHVRAALPPPPAVLAQATAEVAPQVKLLTEHAAYAAAQALQDATAARMRLLRAHAEAQERTSHLLTSTARIEEAKQQREKEMAALVRHEKNQKELRATRRGMVRGGVLDLDLLAVEQLGDAIPAGCVARFEVCLSYTSPSLPVILTHTLPFAPTQTNGQAVAELLQSIRLPILNAHVQCVRVSLHALQPKQLMKWIFHHRVELFGEDGGSGGGGAHGLIKQGGVSPIEYLKHCEAEVMSLSVPARGSWMPPSGRPKSGRMLLHSGTPRPKSSQTLVLHSQHSTRPHTGAARDFSQTAGDQAAGWDFSLSPYQASDQDGSASDRRGPNFGGERASSPVGSHGGADSSSAMAEYQRGLSAWFRQSAKSSSRPGTAVLVAGSAHLATPRSEMLVRHVIDEGGAETFGSWLQAITRRMAAYNTYIQKRDAGEDLSEYHPDGSHRSPSVEPPDAAQRRQATMRGWNVEQCSEFLLRIGLGDTTIFKRRAIAGPELLDSRATMETMLLQKDKESRLAEAERRHAQQHPDDLSDGLSSSSRGRAAGKSMIVSAALVDRMAEESGNNQRSADALRLLHTLRLLTGQPLASPSSGHFPFDRLIKLRKVVFDAFGAVTAKYARQRADAKEVEQQLTTTAALSKEEADELSARLTAHKNKLGERTLAELAAGKLLIVQEKADTGDSHEVRQTKKKEALTSKLLRDTQLRVMERMSAESVQEWRQQRRGKQTRPDTSVVEIRDEDSQDSDAEEAHPSQLSDFSIRDGARTDSSLSLRRPDSGSPVTNFEMTTMFASRPASRQGNALAPAPLPFSSTSSRPSSTESVLVLGCFDLPIRRVARCDEGVFHGFMRLRPPAANEAGLEGSGVGAAPAAREDAVLTDTERVAAAARHSAVRAHFRKDLTSTLHSGSARTYLPGSGVASLTQKHLAGSPAPSPLASPPTNGPSRASPPGSWYRASLRAEQESEAQRAAEAWRKNARVEVRAKFTLEVDLEEEYLTNQSDLVQMI